MSRRRSSSHHQSEPTVSSPVGSGCSPDYFSEDIFPPIDPHEDPAGHWTQSGPLAQDADPFGFLNQEELREMSSGSMPQMASDFSVLDNDFLRVTAIDPHPQTIDPACLNLATSAHCGLDLSSAISPEAFQASTSPAGSQDSGPPVPIPSNDVGSLVCSGEVLRDDQAQSHSLTSDDESSSAYTSSGSISGTANGNGRKYREDAIICMRKDECVKDGIFFCNRENCNKQYRKNSQRTKHLRSHYRPVHCLYPGCGYRCAQRKEMKKHLNSRHAEEKSYHQCPITSCRESFTRQDNLHRHLDEIHGGKKRAR